LAAARWALGPLEILLVQRWLLEIKEPEKHSVVIEKRRERWLAGLRPQQYRVFVDGQCVKECRGY